MQPKTEELLGMLLWTLDTAMRPTFRNLNQSYEAWAYHTGFYRQVKSLERRGFLERNWKGGAATRIYRLTDRGLLHAMGGRDPEAEWNRHWDGKWRMVLFDIGEAQSAQRDRLRRYLRSAGFGYLQHSVWISPRPLALEKDALSGAVADVGSLILLEARPVAGESDEEIVRGAWDFAEINKRYAQVLSVLGERPKEPLHVPGAARRLRDWAARERAAWWHALKADPLLPRKLWPRGYGGERAWKRRRSELSAAGRCIAEFKQEAD